MAGPVMKFLRTEKSANLNLLEVKDGQLIFVEDSKKIYLDNSTGRVEYGQIISLLSEEERNKLPFPVVGAFYFVQETNCFWRYERKWIQITPTPENEIYFLDILPDVGIEQRIYIKEQKLYEWSDNKYKELANPTWDTF